MLRNGIASEGAVPCGCNATFRNPFRLRGGIHEQHHLHRRTRCGCRGYPVVSRVCIEPKTDSHWQGCAPHREAQLGRAWPIRPLETQPFAPCSPGDWRVGGHRSRGQNRIQGKGLLSRPSRAKGSCSTNSYNPLANCGFINKFQLCRETLEGTSTNGC